MGRTITYWLFTGLLAAWLIAGGGFDIVHANGAIDLLRKLGYPAYLGSILGPAKLLAAPAILFARWPTLREWAYAGVAFDGLGAFFSHVAVHDSAVNTVAPLVFLAFAAISYALRPSAPQTLPSPVRSADPVASRSI
jgi:hypothetical protein